MIGCLPGTLLQKRVCPPSPSHLFQQRLLWNFCHYEQTETNKLATDSQVSGVDVGVWSVAVKRGMFSQEGARVQAS